MPYAPPKVIGHGAEQMKLLRYAKLEAQERYIANGPSSAGPEPREVCGVAICKDVDGFYLFSCDERWHVMFDTFHATVEEAEAQADYEFPGVLARLRRDK